MGRERGLSQYCLNCFLCVQMFFVFFFKPEHYHPQSNIQSIQTVIINWTTSSPPPSLQLHYPQSVMDAFSDTHKMSINARSMTLQHLQTATPL